MFSNVKLLIINKLLILLSASAGRWCSDWDKAFFNSKLLLTLTHQLIGITFVVPPGLCQNTSATDSHLCSGSEPILSGNTHTWATASTVPLTLPTRTHWTNSELVLALPRAGSLAGKAQPSEPRRVRTFCCLLQWLTRGKCRAGEKLRGKNKHYLRCHFITWNSISHKTLFSESQTGFFRAVVKQVVQDKTTLRSPGMRLLTGLRAKKQMSVNKTTDTDFWRNTSHHIHPMEK